MIVASGIFFHGICIVSFRIKGAVQNKVSKSGGASGPSEVEKFLSRMNKLATIMGVSLILGAIAFLLYVIGYNNVPQVYSWPVMIGMFLFTSAGLAQTIFAAETLLKSVPASKSKVMESNKTTVVGGSTTTPSFAGGKSDFESSKVGSDLESTKSAFQSIKSTVDITEKSEFQTV